MHHAENTKVPVERPTDDEIIIGYHQTSHAAAYSIAKTNFELSGSGLIGEGVYFARCMTHTEFKANQYGAYICAEVDLGKCKRTPKREPPSDLKGFDTVYFEHPQYADEFCILNAKQVRSWIIVVDQKPNVRDIVQSYFKKPEGVFNKSEPSDYVADFLDDRFYPSCLN